MSAEAEYDVVCAGGDVDRDERWRDHPGRPGMAVDGCCPSGVVGGAEHAIRGRRICSVAEAWPSLRSACCARTAPAEAWLRRVGRGLAPPPPYLTLRYTSFWASPERSSRTLRVPTLVRLAEIFPTIRPAAT